MKLIVLAAGFATRLWPLTKHRAKPLLDVGGVTVLDRLLEPVLRVSSLDSMWVVTNARFLEDFRAWQATRSASALACTVLGNDAQSADELRGALADLALALEHAGPSEGGYFVIAGDNLLEFELEEHAQSFREHGCRSTLLVRKIPGGIPPKRHGEVTCADDGRVTRFREKPEKPESELAATGIYFLPPRLPALLTRYLEAGGNRDAPGHFLAWLAAEDELHARIVDGRIWDIGNLETLERARAHFDAQAPRRD